MRWEILIAMALGIFLVFLGISIQLKSNSIHYNLIKTNLSDNIKYIPHGVIKINSNFDFENIAQQEGWSGNGTQENPYIIKGYEINAYGARDGIYIGNTTLYFKIIECLIYNASQAGIHFYRVKNGSIEDVILYDNGKGIYFERYCYYCNIYNCTIYNNSMQGIMIEDGYYYTSNHDRIKNCHIFNNSCGISFYNTRDSIIEYCYIYNNKNEGISIDQDTALQENNIIRYCYIAYNGYNGFGYGIYIICGNKISHNDIIYNDGQGIWIAFESNIITYNNISYNKDYAIYCERWSSNNIIHHNTFIMNKYSNSSYNASNIQAYDEGNDNLWYDTQTEEGNYWHDWANNNDTNDQNHDGIVDWPYLIAGSAGAKDYYPLKNPTVVSEISVDILWVFIILSVFILEVTQRDKTKLYFLHNF